jgi:hypothetical protein
LNFTLLASATEAVMLRKGRPVHRKNQNSSLTVYLYKAKVHKLD